MNGIFRHDGPLFGFISRLGDMVVLNLLMLVFSIPLITIGASLTAGYYAAIRSIRGEGNVLRDFWQSFRENLRQAVLIWMLFLLIIGGGFAAIWLMGEQTGVLGVVILAAIILLLPVGLWVFPVLSKFADSTPNIFRNGAVLCFRYFLRTLTMAVSWLLPVAVLLISFYALPGVILLGISVPVYIGAGLVNRVFLALEDQIRQRIMKNAS